jgi:hypothetical protein
LIGDLILKKILHVGELISIHFKDRKTPIFGIVAGFSQEWVLLKSNVVDYVIDGYTILKRVNITEIRRGAEEKFREKILKLKGETVNSPFDFALTDLSEILNQLEAKFGVFELQEKAEGKCYIGRLKSITNKELIIYTLSPKGKWKGQLRFKLNDVRVIQFETDYINSLKLVATPRNR